MPVLGSDPGPIVPSRRSSGAISRTVVAAVLAGVGALLGITGCGHSTSPPSFPNLSGRALDHARELNGYKVNALPGDQNRTTTTVTGNEQVSSDEGARVLVSITDGGIPDIANTSVVSKGPDGNTDAWLTPGNGSSGQMMLCKDLTRGDHQIETTATLLNGTVGKTTQILHVTSPLAEARGKNSCSLA